MNKKALLRFVFVCFQLTLASVILPGAAWAVCDANSSMDDCMRELSKQPPDGKNIHFAKFSGLLNDTKKSSALYVVCNNNDTILFIDWHHPVARFGTLLSLTYQIDQQPGESAKVMATTEATGQTQFLEPMPLAKKLLDAKTFRASVVNASGEKLTALFDTRQAANALTHVREACHW